MARARGWRSAYHWPMALYYIKTTPVHAHPALFGVYGRLGIGLMWFCRRGRLPGPAWKDGP